ncbi:unnamed protein product [Prorocentrum cordatum]|uniref:Reverse transcriptase domain-containing protein n=1 Tax=Prorocentrum cordatum TaxID=2364126 RepID=A0ABN9SB97_9DINO|nr:unnamed protein product [Polarella glacialis]
MAASIIAISSVATIPTSDAVPLMQALSTPLFPERVRAAIVLAINNKVSAAVPELTPGSAGRTELQNAAHIHDYFTQEDWLALTGFNKTSRSRLEVVVNRMRLLNILNPNETTKAHAVLLTIRAATPVGEEPPLRPATTLNLMNEFKTILRRVRRFHASTVAPMVDYYEDPQQLRTNNPDLYAQAYPSDAPIPCPSDVGQLEIMRRQLPLRASHGAARLQPASGSGSIIDVVASSPELVTEVKVVAPADAGLRSDHRRLDVSVAGVVDCTGESAVGFARWVRGADWGEALLLAPLALRFLVGWAGTAMRSAVVRRWVVEGRCRGTRQGLLDRVVWWRAVVYTLAGHFAGMSVAHGPRGQPRGVGAAGADRDDDDEGVGPGELRAARAAAAAGDADPPARKAATRALDRYLELAAASPGEAEAFLSRALEPRLPVQLALRCPVSGELLGLADALEVITEDALSRGAQAGSGDAAFNRAVADEVRQARRESQAEAAELGTGDPFSLDDVNAVLREMKGNRRSLYLPRAAVLTELWGGRLVTWALVCLVAVSGLMPSGWRREVAPIRKRGPVVVSDVAHLRPVSYVDELCGTFDAVWLRAARGQLEAHAGAPQAGGKYDAVLMVIGTVMALQIRRAHGLSTLVEKADLEHGYDLAWRDAVRVHLRRAGLGGHLWPVADAALGSETIRVRIGGIAGAAAVPTEFGVGQGRRAGVRMFGALVRALLDACSAVASGVGVAPPAVAARAFHECHQAATLAPGTEIAWGAVRAEELLVSVRPGVPDWHQHLQALGTVADRCAFLDAVAAHALLILQFVDDSFVFQSSAAGLAAVNRALTEFCLTWRHRFQGGRKRPMVLAVGGGPVSDNFGTVCGVPPEVTQVLDMLGAPVEQDLGFHALLGRACSRLRDGARKLAAALAQRGFGLPYQVAQLPARVVAKAFYGAELLASFASGWQAAVTRVNHAQYEVAKMLLGGGPGVSLGTGGHVRALAETRMLTRWGTTLMQRIALGRARLLARPHGTPVAQVVAGTRATTGATWLGHAAEVSRALGITVDLPAGALSEEARADPEARKRAVQHWKRTVVLPAVLAYEQAWFVLQLGAVGTSGLLPYRELIPVRGPLSAGVRWAPWGRAMWRFYQAWALARASGRMPVEVWLAEGVAAVPLACPLCAAPAPEGCTLVECLGHLLSACPAVAPLRVACSTSDVARWALGDVEDTAALAPRVRLVGLASRAWVLGVRAGAAGTAAAAREGGEG